MRLAVTVLSGVGTAPSVLRKAGVGERRLSG